MHFVRRAPIACGLALLLPACVAREGDTHDPTEPPPWPSPSTDLETPATPVSAEVRPPAIAPGESPSSSLVEPAPKPACPDAMVRVEGFCIDRWEAHLVHRDAAGQLRRHPHFERPEQDVTYEARSASGVFPQAYISRVESESACAAAGKRLCSRREWQRACKGTKNSTYPYGLRVQPGRCNADKPHLLTWMFGADPRRWTYAMFNDPSLSREPGFLARSGDYADCTTDAGVHDMVGNLHEWVSDTADATFRARVDSEGIPRAFQYWNPRNGVFMGGFYSTHGELGPGCTFTTIAHEPGYHDYSTGFRCCAEQS